MEQDLFTKIKPTISIEELSNIELRVVQTFGNHNIPLYAKRKKHIPANIISYIRNTPRCDIIECNEYANVMICTPEGKGWCLCKEHLKIVGQ